MQTPIRMNPKMQSYNFESQANEFVKKEKSLVYKINSKAMNSTAKLNELSTTMPDFWRMITIQEYKESGWHVKVILSRNLSAISSDLSKDKALKDCHDIIWKKIIHCKYEEGQHLRLLLSGDVELNPGPISIQRSLIKVYENGTTSKIILPNGKTFDLKNEDFEVKGHEIIFHKIKASVKDEILGAITVASEVLNEIVSGAFDVQGEDRIPLKRSTKWSNHDDFDPLKRFQLSPSKKFVKEMGSNHFDLFDKNDVCGHTTKLENVIFVPKDAIHFRFNKVHMSAKQLNINTFNQMMSSILGQEMNGLQMAQSASLLTTVQMTYLRFRPQYEVLLSAWFAIFEQTVNFIAKNSPAQNNRHSISDLWLEMKKTEVIIPTYSLETHEKINEELRLERIEEGKLKIEKEFWDLRIPKYLKRKEFSDDPKTLAREYKEGLYSIFTDTHQLRMTAKITNLFLKTEVVTDLTDLERAVSVLVEDRMYEDDVYQSLNRMVDYAASRCSVETLTKIVKKLSKGRFIHFYNPGMRKLYEKRTGRTKLDIPSHTSDQIDYIREKLFYEKRLGQLAQLEFQAWMAFFGSPSRTNVFYNTPYILRMAIARRGVVTKRSDDQEATTSGGVEGESWLKTTVLSPIRFVTNVAGNISSGVDSLKDLSQTMKTMKSSLVDQFTKTGMGNFAKSINDLDFSSFKGALSTAKTFINMWFSDFVKKIGEVFGVEIEETMDATTLLFYYLIWVGTENQTLKLLLVLDILTQVGLLDFFMKYIYKLGKAFAQLFVKQKGAFEDYLQEMDLSTSANIEKVEKIVKEEVEKQPPKTLDETETWLNTILKQLESATTPMLGVAGTILIGMLGMTPFRNKDPSCFGERVVKTMRNLSFLSLGLMAIPKIFVTMTGIINTVIDYGKELVCEEHESKITTQKRIEEWLKKALYTENATKTRLVSDFNSVVEFFGAYGEMKELQAKAVTITNAALATEFRDRCRIMEHLFPIAKSAARLVLGGREIFHVQLWSEEVGVGKTDTAQILLKEIEQTLIEEENKIRGKIGLKPNPIRNVVGHVFPLNDHLKHNDMYFGQILGYVDEALVFKNPEQDVVVNTMMMLSGFPTISQQASLADKGRLFEFEAIVSNTNNAFATVDNMYNVTALQRRRHLVKVNIKPRFAIVGADGKTKLNVTALSAACDAGEIDRNKLEHLTFSILKPTENVLLHPSLSDITAEQLVQWCKISLKKHIAIEEHRLFARNVEVAMLRHEFHQLMKDMTIAYGGNKTDFVTPKEIRQKLTQLRKFKKENTPFKDGKNEVNEETEKRAWNTLEDFVAVNDVVEHYGSAVPAKNSLDTVYKMCVLLENKTYLANSPVPNVIIKGVTDLTRFKWDKVRQSVCWEGQPTSSTLYWLSLFDVALNEKDLETMLKVQELKDQKAGWKEVFKTEMENIQNSTKRAVTSIGNWIMNKLMSPVFKSFVNGVSLALACGVMFFSLSLLGQLLSPNPKSYSSKEEKRGLFRPTAKSYEEHYDQELDLGRKGVYSVIVVHQDGSYSRGNAIGLQGSVFLINDHTMRKIEEKEIYIYDHYVGQIGDGIKKYPILQSDISPIPGCDGVLVNIRGYRPVRSLLKHFVSEEDLKDNMMNFANGQYAFLSLNPTKHPTRERDFTDGKYQLRNSGFYYGSRAHYQTTDHTRVIMMSSNLKVEDGMSGALAIHSNPKIQRKFLGLLLASDPVGGVYLGVISREQLEKALEKFSVSSKANSVHPNLITLKSDHQLFDVFDMKNELYHSPYPTQAISQSSGFRRSPIFGVVPNETEPAIQHYQDRRIPNDARHFLKVSLNKTNGLHEPFISAEEEVFAKAFLRMVYKKYVPQLNTVRVYSTKEAITGVRMMGSTSINTKTSPGLPYKLDRGVKGKAPFISFNVEQKSWMIQNRVYDDVEFYERCYNLGELPGAYKLEFRKKELVPEKKILEPKTRTVATGNMINQIVYDKNFKDLYRLTKNVWENGAATPFALGVDPERHWDQIAKHLKYENNIVDFDVKAWEEKVCLKLLLMTADVKIKIIEDAYKSRNEQPPNIRNIVECLAIDYTDTYVVFEDLVYRKRNGLLSGHPGTFMENSEIHEIILAIAVRRILIKKHPSWANIAFIQEHVKSIKAADDIQIGISNLLRQILTVEDLVREYNNLGFEVTSADKNSAIRFKHLTESQFLKHGYRKTDGMYFAVPNSSIVNQLFNWMRTDTVLNDREQFLVNIDNAFRFLFWRGEEEYESIRDKINIALMSHDFEWPYDYNTMRLRIKMHLQQSRQEALDITPQEVEEFYM